MFSFPDCENPLNRGCYYFKPQGSYDIQKPKRMFFKFTFVFTWLKLSVKKGSKQNKTKKTRTVTLRPHHVRQSPYPCRFLFAYMYYRIPFSKGTNSYFFLLFAGTNSQVTDFLRNICFGLLNDALCHHRVGNLHEAGDISALHVVDIAVRLCTVLNTLLVDRVHDVVELLVHLSLAPCQAY